MGIRFGFRVQGFGFSIQGLGFRVSRFTWPRYHEALDPQWLMFYDMSYCLTSLQGGYVGDYIGEFY